MIRIGEHTFLVLFPDGRSVPFDPAYLQERLSKVLSRKIDQGETVAQDIASAIEMTLIGRKETSIREESLNELVVHILNSVGLGSAAAEYRDEVMLNGVLERIPAARLKTFLEEHLYLTGTALDRIAEKVCNTMKSIGAGESSPALALELAKHFLTVSADNLNLNIEIPDFTPDKEYTIRPEEITGHLPPESAAFFEKRIFKINPVNLKIFPALRLSVRLTGIATENNLLAPLTELALAPGLIRAAKAADEVCLAADDLFRAYKRQNDVPVKIHLHLSDASLFSRNWMGCNSVEAQEKCAVTLCRLFAAEMTRVPFNMTCT